MYICQDIGLILLKFGAGGYFWILSPKSTLKFLCDVIFTSKWREGKIPIYRLQKVHITSLWRYLLSDFFENVNLFSSYDGLSSHQIWFDLDEGKQSYGGGRKPPPPPGWECIKTPRWDRVKIFWKDPLMTPTPPLHFKHLSLLPPSPSTTPSSPIKILIIHPQWFVGKTRSPFLLLVFTRIWIKYSLDRTANCESKLVKSTLLCEIGQPNN